MAAKGSFISVHRALARLVAPTAIGADGTVYAINDGFFYAVGN